jgi:hypothetical protein
MLANGIRISHSHGISLISQVEINHGMDFAKSPSYKPFSIVPKQRWRPLSLEEIQILQCPNGGKEMWRSIGIVNFPHYCFRHLHSMGFSNIHSEEELLMFRKEVSFDDCFSPIPDYIEDAFLLHGKCIHVPVSAKKPNLLTVSSDSGQDCEEWVGLHVDTWDRKGIRDLESARNRICINLGQESRYFLFVNLTIKQIIQMLKGKIEKDFENLFHKHALLQEFVKAFPDYPVIKIELKPQQAYIAPTENMYHDASTVGMQTLDIHFTSRGYFSTTRQVTREAIHAH